jgi:E3 ubiquitin-protein ligase RNF14
MADLNAAADERAEELDTLQSIYPELLRDPADPYAATLDLLVAPATPLPVTFDPELTVQRLAYLPSLHLSIRLPAHYPAAEPPHIVVSTTPPWLPGHVASRLAAEAAALWEEYGRATILFSYIASLQEQAETAFGLGQLVLPASLQRELQQHSSYMQRDLFEKETFDCDVCLEPKKGFVCYRMERCGHVFCRACLQDYYNNCIREGDVNNVKCMSADCGRTADGRRKKDRLLSPKELLKIPLSRDVVERYATIKRKKKMESDSTMVFCPRSWCQGAMRTAKYPKLTDVALIDNSDSEDDQVESKGAPIPDGPEKRAIGVKGMDRLAVCEDCTLAFCLVCLASWHGDFVRCEPRDANQLTEEDQASLNFILKNTSPCPYCSVPCQKSMGCNHITCTQCKTHFCYLCGAWLDPGHPYGHFNDSKNKNCYQRLMDGVEGDMANGDVQFGGRRGAEQLADFWEEEAMRLQMQINEQDML